MGIMNYKLETGVALRAIQTIARRIIHNQRNRIKRVIRGEGFVKLYSSLIQIIIDAKVYALALQGIFSSIALGALGEGIAIVHPQVQVG